MARKAGVPVVATFHSKYRDDFMRAVPNKALVDYLVGKVVRFYEHVDESQIIRACLTDWVL